MKRIKVFDTTYCVDCDRPEDEHVILDHEFRTEVNEFLKQCHTPEVRPRDYHALFTRERGTV